MKGFGLGGAIELFPIPTSAPQLGQESVWYVIPSVWYGAYKICLAVNPKE